MVYVVVPTVGVTVLPDYGHTLPSVPVLGSPETGRDPVGSETVHGGFEVHYSLRRRFGRRGLNTCILKGTDWEFGGGHEEVPGSFLGV